ncbi:hypothetical protein [Actinosynnema sp. NPDC023587]|uniref:hypothetical protein n=1 Tax=Actinosynnema sp. NPDC023587 TaxID=3154695 RepID=UPI0033E0857B
MTGSGAVGMIITAEEAPPFLVDGFGLWVLLAVVTAGALVGIVVRSAVRMRWQDVRGIHVKVTSRDQHSFLPVPGTRSQRLRFAIEVVGDKLLLRHTADDEPAYEIYRVRSGVTGSGVRLRHLDGRTFALSAYQPVTIGPGLDVLYGEPSPTYRRARSLR